MPKLLKILIILSKRKNNGDGDELDNAENTINNNRLDKNIETDDE